MRPSRPIRSRLAWAALPALVASACGVGSDAGRLGGDASPGACPAVAGQTIRFIVPNSAGGGYDIYARLLEPYLERALDSEIVVENRPGAGGRVAGRTVRDAAPNGRTLGILNATSLLVSELADDYSGLDPFENFTPIGRIARSEGVLATAAGSGLETIGSVAARGYQSPLLVGIVDVGSTSFVSVGVTSEILGVEVRYLAGYPGTREASLGLLRGEYDVGGFTLESVMDRITSGDLTPVLQISSEPLSDHPLLRDVPVLGGPAGFAAEAMRARGEDPARAFALAEALIGMYEAGRIVVGPPGLSADLAACLSEQLAAVADSDDFLAAAALAGRSIGFLGPASLAETSRASRAHRRTLGPILRRHIELARGASGG
jgi:tripartite-type tricarboxylate transporter receptor subunit TctC